MFTYTAYRPHGVSRKVPDDQASRRGRGPQVSAQTPAPPKVSPGVALRRGGLRPGRVGPVVRVLAVLRHWGGPREATDRRGRTGPRGQAVRAKGREENVLTCTMSLVFLKPPPPFLPWLTSMLAGIFEIGLQNIWVKQGLFVHCKCFKKSILWGAVTNRVNTVHSLNWNRF